MGDANGGPRYRLQFEGLRDSAPLLEDLEPLRAEANRRGTPLVVCTDELLEDLEPLRAEANRRGTPLVVCTDDSDLASRVFAALATHCSHCQLCKSSCFSGDCEGSTPSACVCVGGCKD